MGETVDEAAGPPPAGSAPWSSSTTGTRSASSPGPTSSSSWPRAPPGPPSRDVRPGFETLAIHAGQEPEPADRSGGDADLPDVNLRPDGGGTAPGLRVQPQRQPDPIGARDAAWPPSRAAATGWPSPADWPPRTPSCACCGPATTSSSPMTPTAVPTGWWPRCTRPTGVGFDPVRLGDLDAVAAAWRPETRMVWVETPHQSAALDRRHRRGGGDRPTNGARSWWSTTPSPPPTCSGRSLSAPTSSCTRPPSTWAVTATWWAVPWSWATRQLAEPPRPSCRTRRGRSRARSTASSPSEV